MMKTTNNARIATAQSARLEVKRKPSRLIRLLGDLLADKLNLIWLTLLLVWLVTTAIGPLIAPFDPTRANLRDSLIPPSWQEGGTSQYILGTDALGRDILSRLFYGSRVTFVIAISVVLLEGIIGSLIGLVSGYWGGKLDLLLMRLTDIYIAFPGLLLALFVVAVLGPGIRNLIIALTLNGWTIFSRTTRGMMLSIREKDYIEAARAIGCRDRRIILRHALPNQMPVLLALSTIEIARIILTESALSFLGLGIQPPDASWGLMIAEGRSYLFKAAWVSTLPGLAIMLTVFALTLMHQWVEFMGSPAARAKSF